MPGAVEGLDLGRHNLNLTIEYRHPLEFKDYINDNNILWIFKFNPRPLKVINLIFKKNKKN